MEYQIILIGCGTVGQGFLEILDRKAELLRDVYKFEPKVIAITDMLKGSLLAPDGIQLKKLLEVLKAGKKLNDYPGPKEKTEDYLDPIDLIEQVEADILAEVTYTDIKTGEPATSYIKKALRTGKHVVTSNKGPAALHYHELKELAHLNQRHFRIEGTVMSGTPVFHLFETGLAGNEIREVKGILNGTTNFILSQMELEEMEYDEALKLAQELGYAEADPTADVEGFDAVAKVVILANAIMRGKIKPDEVNRQGISTLRKQQIIEAREAGLRYKLIARVKKVNNHIEASVTPEKLPLTDPLAGVMGAQNALTFDTDLLGKVTIQGAGAGRLETGFSILSDMLAISKSGKN
ncbi:MAG: homoserine dehydrogenase [Acidobacteriota bacterium]|nr:homoserine dehydrogenase [Acidobacteriota bacterium]MDW3228248.1 homoserine dehydrogenase [Acidobacteriota bacterium]